VTTVIQSGTAVFNNACLVDTRDALEAPLPQRSLGAQQRLEAPAEAGVDRGSVAGQDHGSSSVSRGLRGSGPDGRF
jgi:hypothetical protein